jgi:hypothetical protein
MFHVPRRELEQHFEIVLLLETAKQLDVTYRSSFVSFKCAVVDHHSAFIYDYSSALKVACGPPGI